MVFKDGNQTWNKGLTKETDERVRRNAEVRRGQYRSKEVRLKMSKAWEKRRLVPLSIETRKRRGEARKGEKNHFFGKHHSEEAKRKIGEASKGRISWVKGKHRSEETKRKLSEAGKLRVGEKNHQWRGGLSFEPYSVDWNRKLRQFVRERDKYVCQVCMRQQRDVIFNVHHIDYNKKNCSSNNLITLCRTCHSKTNKCREYWIYYFKSRMSPQFDTSVYKEMCGIPKEKHYPPDSSKKVEEGNGEE